MLAKVIAAVIIATVSVAGFGVFWYSYQGLGGGTAGSISTVTTSSTSTQCTSSQNSVSTDVLNGTIAYSSSGAVQITSAQALVYGQAGGNSSLVFRVGFLNGGTTPIYVAGGCGSSLTSTIVSGSGAVETVRHLTRCLCAEMIVPVQPGGSATAVDPGCWSGYGYRVTGSGSITANLTLTWSGSQDGSLPRATSAIVSFYVPPGV